jgi:hypothetical protein
MSVFGRGHFSEDQAERWRRAHSPTTAERGAVDRLKRASERIVLDWRYGYVLLPLGVVAIALGPRSREVALLAILLLVQLIFWLGFTHLQSRFFVLAIPICAMLISLVNFKPFRLACAVAVCIATVVSFARLHQIISRYPRDVIGLQQITGIHVDPQEIPRDGPIFLAGDAAAFWYQVPMSRLRYRTVFDVNAKPGQSTIEAWTEGWPDDAPTYVSPQELVRFSKTYWKIPEPAADVADRAEAYWIRR